MSTKVLQTSHDFDCSVYLSHGLTWPVDECSSNHGWGEPRSTGLKGDEYYNYISKPVEREPTSFCHQRRWNQEDTSSISYREDSELAYGAKNSLCKSSEGVDKFSEEHYYDREYTSLLKWIDEEEIIIPPPSHFADKREEIRQISQLADQALPRAVDYPLCHKARQYSKNLDHGRKCANIAVGAAPPSKELCHDIASANSSKCSFSCEDLANEVATRVIETPRTTNQGMSPEAFEDFVTEQLAGFGESNEQRETVFRKRRLCRHFVKGFCLRGDSCDFLHDRSFFCTDEQKVFLGGLPQNLTAEALKTKLERQGFTILNKPRVIRGFTPKVCLGSVEEAGRLVAMGSITIDGHNVDVRPYKDKDHLRKGLPSVVKRSVFLGGLPENTNSEMIVSDLQRLDIKVVQCPVVKDGYAPRVVLDSLESAKMLVSLKRVMVNGTAVDVRPYVNFRKRY